MSALSPLQIIFRLYAPITSMPVRAKISNPDTLIIIDTLSGYIRDEIGIKDLIEDSAVDLEDWVENIAMLMPLYQRLQDNPSFFITHGRIEPHNTAIVPRKRQKANAQINFKAPTAVLGRNTMGYYLSSFKNIIWPLFDTNKAINDYVKTASFNAYAGRKFILGGIGLEDKTRELRPLCDQLQEKSDGKEFMLKIVETAKYAPLEALDLPPDAPVGSLGDLATRALGFNALPFEGVEGAFLVQEKIPMIKEFRLFFISGKIAGGSFVRDDFIPGQNDHLGDFLDVQPTSPLTTDRATDPAHYRISTDETNKDLVTRYIIEAEKIIEGLMEENPDVFSTAFTMDLCLNGDTDDICLIELNPFTNAGLYNTAPALLSNRLLTMIDQKYTEWQAT